MRVCTSTMRYNLLNIWTVMMLVVGSEQLLGRQHLSTLPPIWDSWNACSFSGPGVNPGAKRITYDIMYL